MVISRSNITSSVENVTIRMNGKCLKPVKSMKILSCVLDQNLKWSAHLANAKTTKKKWYKVWY